MFNSVGDRPGQELLASTLQCFAGKADWPTRDGVSSGDHADYCHVSLVRYKCLILQRDSTPFIKAANHVIVAAIRGGATVVDDVFGDDHPDESN